MNRPPILMDFPSSFETERLTIRCPLPGDGPEVNAAISESIDDLKPWMPWAQSTPSVEDTEANIRQAHCEFLARRDLRLNLYLKGTGAFVGGSGLHRINWDVPRFEIGYWCRRSFMKQGYITEAVGGITRFAFDVLGAERIEIRCDSKNENSRRVAERSGYILEAELKCDSRDPAGELRNTLVFARLRHPR